MTNAPAPTTRVLVTVTSGPANARTTTVIPGVVLDPAENGNTRVKTDDGRIRSYATLDRIAVAPDTTPEPPAAPAPTPATQTLRIRKRRLSTGDVPRTEQMTKAEFYDYVVSTLAAYVPNPRRIQTRQELDDVLRTVGDPIIGTGHVFHHSPDRFGNGKWISDALAARAARTLGLRPSRLNRAAA